MKRNNEKKNDAEMKNIHINGWRKISLTPLIIFVLVIILTISSEVSEVYALGMAPSRKMYDYSDSTISGSARVLNNDNRDMKILLYAQGEYSDYITLDQSSLIIKAGESEKVFTYSFKLPSNINPGTIKINIVGIEVPQDMEIAESMQTTIVSTLSVAHQVWINVPYSGTFAEGVLYVSEGNVNDTITFTANIVNKGTGDIKKIDGELIIKGPTNEELYRTKGSGLDALNSQTSGKMIANWQASANPGLYEAEFIVNYDDKQMVLRKTFTIGDFYIDIKDINAGNFQLGAIAKFDINLVNKWNQDVNNVYADLQIIDEKGSILSAVRTSPADMKASSTNTLSAYWDTKDVKVGTYDIKVLLYYSGRASEKIFKTVVGIDSIQVKNFALSGQVVSSGEKGNKLSILYILVLASIIFNIGLFIYFKFMRNKPQQ